MESLTLASENLNKKSEDGFISYNVKNPDNLTIADKYLFSHLLDSLFKLQEFNPSIGFLPDYNEATDELIIKIKRVGGRSAWNFLLQFETEGQPRTLFCKYDNTKVGNYEGLNEANTTLTTERYIYNLIVSDPFLVGLNDYFAELLWAPNNTYTESLQSLNNITPRILVIEALQNSLKEDPKNFIETLNCFTHAAFVFDTLTNVGLVNADIQLEQFFIKNDQLKIIDWGGVVYFNPDEIEEAARVLGIQANNIHSQRITNRLLEYTDATENNFNAEANNLAIDRKYFYNTATMNGYTVRPEFGSPPSYNGFKCLQLRAAIVSFLRSITGENEITMLSFPALANQVEFPELVKGLTKERIEPVILKNRAKVKSSINQSLAAYFDTDNLNDPRIQAVYEWANKYMRFDLNSLAEPTNLQNYDHLIQSAFIELSNIISHTEVAN